MEELYLGLADESAVIPLKWKKHRTGSQQTLKENPPANQGVRWSGKRDLNFDER
jgi:hypothetical protein